MKKRTENVFHTSSESLFYKFQHKSVSFDIYSVLSNLGKNGISIQIKRLHQGLRTKNVFGTAYKELLRIYFFAPMKFSKYPFI